MKKMLTDTNGAIVGEAVQNGPRDALGRAMYSLSTGTGNFLADLIWNQLGLQTRCLRPGSLGRAVSFCQSQIDRNLALAVGREAATRILANDAGHHMITIDEQLQLSTQELNLAAGEKPLTDKFLDNSSPYQVTDAFRQFALPLIGEIQPLFDATQLDFQGAT